MTAVAVPLAEGRRPRTTAVTAMLARRSLTRIVRIPAAVIPTVAMPVFLLISFSGAFQAVTEVPGFPTDSILSWVAPYAIIQGAAFAGVGASQAVAADIHKTYANVRFEKLVLIGHSNGGDIGMLFSTLYSDQVARAVTLDHRRMPVPRSAAPKILSIRADEFQADPGVLPSADEQARYGIKVVTLANTKHADLSDYGSDDTKRQVTTAILEFLED